MAKSYCNNCGITHTSIMCFNKPRIPIRPKPNLTWDQTVDRWYALNPPDENGNWICYLQIADLCPKLLDKEQITLEHVIPKSRGKKYKYNVNNIRPACVYCNSLKGSRTLEDLVLDYPKVQTIVDNLNKETLSI